MTKAIDSIVAALGIMLVGRVFHSFFIGTMEDYAKKDYAKQGMQNRFIGSLSCRDSLHIITGPAGGLLRF